MYRYITVLLIGSAAVLWQACSSGTPASEPHSAPLAGYFKPLAAQDTLYLGTSTPAAGDTLPWTELLREVPAALIDSIADLGDTADITVLALGTLPVTERYDSYLIELRFAWFIHRGLLLYDKQAERFVRGYPLSIYYGGDGGQIATESFRVDLDQDNRPDWLIRQMEHSIRPEGDLIHDTSSMYLTALRWQDSLYTPYSPTDTAALNRRFPKRWDGW